MKEKFGRWNILFFQYLKRDWRKVIVWVLGLGLFASGFVPAFKEMAKGEGLIGMFEALQNPAMISIVGPSPIKIASEYTLGAMYAHEMLLFCGLFAMIISILHVIGHSRKEEDLGLTELVRSFHVGRQANSLAVIVETILINTLLSSLIFLVLTSFNAPTISREGALLFAMSVGLAGLMGAAIALVIAQIMPVSSAATGASLGVVGLLYVMRGATDISNLSLSMANPLAWTYLTYPFTENNWKPIIFGLIFALFLIIIAFILEGARDMGAGYIAPREGRTHAKKSLLSVQGLFIRLNRGLIISWLLAYLILAASYGAIYGDMGTFLQGNEFMKQMFTYRGITIEESFTSTIMLVMIGLVTVLPLAIVNRLFSEEKNLHLSQIYGTKVRRSQLYWTNIALALATGILGILLAAGGLGLTATNAMKGGAMAMLDFFIIGFSLLPSALFFIGLAALVLGFMPKLGKLIYIYLVYSFFLNYFGAILNLPSWVEKTAPQSWLPKIPMEDFDIRGFAMMTALSLVFIVVGYWGYRRRDMVEGA